MRNGPNQTSTQGSNAGKLFLDIDETLAFTVVHWIQRLRTTHGDPAPDLSALEIYQKFGLAQFVPTWRHNEAAHRFMESLRNSPEEQIGIPVVPGAQEGVSQLQKVTQLGGYITMRPESVLSATQAWLSINGFPSLPIIAKPASVASAAAPSWKASVLAAEYPQIVGIVEDRADVALALPATYRGTVYLLGHEKSPRNDSVHIVPCADWSRVVEAARAIEPSRSVQLNP